MSLQTKATQYTSTCTPKCFYMTIQNVSVNLIIFLKWRLSFRLRCMYVVVWLLYMYLKVLWNISLNFCCSKKCLPWDLTMLDFLPRGKMLWRYVVTNSSCYRCHILRQFLVQESHLCACVYHVLRLSIYKLTAEHFTTTSCLLHSENIPPHTHVQSSRIYGR